MLGMLVVLRNVLRNWAMPHRVAKLLPLADQLVHPLDPLAADRLSGLPAVAALCNLPVCLVVLRHLGYRLRHLVQTRQPALDVRVKLLATRGETWSGALNRRRDTAMCAGQSPSGLRKYVNLFRYIPRVLNCTQFM